MNGNASFSAGITHVYAGKLVANGSISSAVTVDAGATLGGTGTVGALTDYGAVSPGASAGRLNSGNVTFGGLQQPRHRTQWRHGRQRVRPTERRWNRQPHRGGPLAA